MSASASFQPAAAPSPPMTDKQVCLHVVEACAELRRQTRRPRLRTVNYLLDMARLEAEKLGKELPD